MLASLGMAGDTEPHATFVEDIDDLVLEVVDDLYLRKFSGSTDAPVLGYATAVKVAREAMRDRQAQLVPSDSDPDGEPGLRVRLARAARTEVDRRKRVRKLLDYDDLLTRLRDVLVDAEHGAAARERVRERYRVVLVDEFQDTDPVQWEILETAFHGVTTLVLVGDPKQAIYAFRGADLVTYLNAAGSASTWRTLDHNWRSDPALLDCLESLFGGAALGDERIVVRQVRPAWTGTRVDAVTGPACLRLRVVSSATGRRSRAGLLLAAPARERVARDVAADIVRLLRGPSTLTMGAKPEDLSPGHIAVLVRTNDQAELVRVALHDRAVPAVLTGSRSVFRSPTAREWLTLLHAIEQPHRAGLVRAAALTCFLGWTAERLAGAGESAVDELGPVLRAWRGVLADRGVAALLEVVMTTTELVPRVLAVEGGERVLTDIRHIGQTLHAAAVQGSLGPAAVVEWLQRRVREAVDDVADERSRRLESDADAVQVVTIHASKGLEFPIVYVPYAWDRNLPDTSDPLRLHDDDGRRLLDVGGVAGPDYGERLLRHRAEELGEDLRLLYVAMTRAQCGIVAWWVPATTAAHSPLHRLLFGEFASGAFPPDRVAVPGDADAWQHLAERASANDGTWAVEVAEPADRQRWRPPGRPAAPLSVGSLTRGLDSAWRRTSYSSLTASLHGTSAAEPGVGSEPEAREVEDEVDTAVAPDAAASLDEELLRAVPSPMAELPSGTAFGTLVHEVLENVDTSAPGLATEVAARCEEAAARRTTSATVDVATLTDALLLAMDTPLGPSDDDPRLRDVAPSDRLAELEFELPLAGGDSPVATDATLGAVAGLLRRHLPGTDVLAGYAQALDVPGLAAQRLRGYLTGSIDSVLRLRDTSSGEPRYVVVDYKTNWLGAFGSDGAEPLTAWHYRPAALAQSMMHAHYPLQALLYSVALHRFLRWRQPSYDPGVHLGGIRYLFVRGMMGASTPVFDGGRCGVFAWTPPPALVEDLSALLDGEAP